MRRGLSRARAGQVRWRWVQGRVQLLAAVLRGSGVVSAVDGYTGRLRVLSLRIYRKAARDAAYALLWLVALP